MVNEDVSPQPGERVSVPWGLEELVGDVIEIYATGLGDRAVVRVVGGPDPDMTVTVNADSLTPVGGNTHGIPAPADVLAFHDRIDDVIKTAVEELGVALVHDERLDRGVDAVISNESRRIAIQVKYFSRNRLPSDNVAVLAAYASPELPVIIISNVDLSAAAEERLERNNRMHRTIWFVRWTSSADNIRVKDAIQQALGLI